MLWENTASFHVFFWVGQHLSIRWFSCMCPSLFTPHFICFWFWAIYQMLQTSLPYAVFSLYLWGIDYKAHSAHPNPWMSKASVFKWSRIACGHAYLLDALKLPLGCLHSPVHANSHYTIVAKRKGLYIFSKDTVAFLSVSYGCEWTFRSRGLTVLPHTLTLSTPVGRVLQVPSVSLRLCAYSYLRPALQDFLLFVPSRNIQIFFSVSGKLPLPPLC